MPLVIVPARGTHRIPWAALWPAPVTVAPSASLWASVPHYVAAAPNPKAALALIRGFLVAGFLTTTQYGVWGTVLVVLATALHPLGRPFDEPLPWYGDDAEPNVRVTAQRIIHRNLVASRVKSLSLETMTKPSRLPA